MIAEGKSIDSGSQGVRAREGLWWVALLVLVTLVWCFTYNRWTSKTWRTPLFYKGDALAEMATAKAYATDHVWPIMPKFPASLGAPFKANWNDHVTSEEGVFAWYALLVRLFGLFAGSNVALLSAHLLAAAGFYVASRQLGTNAPLSFAFATLFAFSAYAFHRNLQHLILTYYWHIPLGLLVASWCLEENSGQRTSRRIFVSAGIAIAFGIQNPYYVNIFVQFLGLCAVVQLIRGRPWKDIVLPVWLGTLALLTFVVMNLDTIYYRISEGPNTEVVNRSYVGLELYALKPLELLLPVVHRIAGVEDWVRASYVRQASFLGEAGSAYLGVVAIIGVVWLSWSTFRGVALNNFEKIPRHFWPILWILMYSVVGGINGLVGIWGMVLFRGSNRFSIVIMALALLFLGREITQRCHRWKWQSISALALVLLLVGLGDQLRTPPSTGSILGVRSDLISDKKFVAEIEVQVPKDSMIFQMPVWDYPESPEVNQMSDYDHFRSYLHSHFLRFSYGSDKGRTRERWQKEAEQLGPAGLTVLLERYGFAAVLLNKSAYLDRGAALVEAFRIAGRDHVISQSHDQICIALQPSAQPTLPPEFDSHWHALEGTIDTNLRWSDGRAAIMLHCENSPAKTIHVVFGLTVVRRAHITISSPTDQLFSATLEPNETPHQVDLPVSVGPGITKLQFDTDRPGELPPNGDPRKLAFNVRDFRVIE